MRIIENKFIPFKGFDAMNLFGILFTRDSNKLTLRVLNHELIHTEQMKEMLYIFFYIWYLIEWIIKLFLYGKKAYYNISFEREAYTFDSDYNYLTNRHKYNWLTRIFS